ncbi:hypothetical protein tb265_14590 [Gemmatimonadetes bacterium T265]|nr:hypothetical protein tb265_14590 [Gemmatimonadetes bacterium T265]
MRFRPHPSCGALALFATLSCAGNRPAPGGSPGALAPFASEPALAAYLRDYAPPAQLGGAEMDSAEPASAVPTVAPTPALNAAAPAVAGAATPVAARAAAPASLTNVQHAGVDEGGIVKRHGDHLVILRRGRLFTVAVGGGALRPVAAVDAFGPGINPQSDWYDELLVSRDRVVVVGYSYARGGTEFGVFEIDDAGQLRYRATYELRSNDYYSSRNYASRLIGTRLIFYSPLALRRDGRDLLASLPAMRRWDGGAGQFRPITTPRHVYRPARPLAPGEQAMLHTVTVCDLASTDVGCEARVVIGPSERVTYVSPSAVYLWTTDGWTGDPSARDRSGADAPRATVYRIPLDGGAPRAIGVVGSPIDQFSFLEGEDGYLNVLVRSDASGDGMWHAELAAAAGSAALLRVPLASFGDGSRSAPVADYRALPATPDGITHDRFVGTHLLYGVGSGWGRPRADSASVYVVPIAGGAVSTVALPHGVDRIEAMGGDAVVAGTDGRDLHFSGVRLRGRPAAVQHFVLPDAAQGELRSHGFFYRDDGADSGVIGLPVRTAGRPGYVHLYESSAAVQFVGNANGHFTNLGALAAREDQQDDACRASCVDWYGNARPLFLDDRRVLALLGYELVEGALRGGRIDEVRRVTFAPRQIARAEWERFPEAPDSAVPVNGAPAGDSAAQPHVPEVPVP